MPEVLTVLSGRESTVRKLDQLRERYGDAPQNWFPMLTGMEWPAESDEPALWIEAAE